MPSDIGQRLQALREEFGLTQSFVAEHVGMRRTALSEVEHGNRKVTPEELVGLARLYGTTTDYLTTGETTSPDVPVEALARAIGGMSDDDIEQVVSFAQFLRSRGGTKESGAHLG